jgi:tRNA(adenine34) deaminase
MLWDSDRFFMGLAIGIARSEPTGQEVPVGAVLVQNGVILSMATNAIVTDTHPLRHAETLALERAFRRTGTLRIPHTTLYTTLEPCAMCAGAIVLARVERVVIGAMDEKRGCGGSVYNLLDAPALNHRARVTTGVRETECAALLTQFFQAVRANKKKKNAQTTSLMGNKER